MAEMTRRNFMMAGAMAGVAAVGLAGLEARADEVAADLATEGAAPDEAVSLTGWTGTPQEIADLGGSTMPLEELNRRRAEYVDAQTEWTCEDGTVIPAWAVKIRALIHTYGMGCGNTPLDTSFGDIMDVFADDEGAAFLDMPRGVKFTPLDLYEKGGRTIEECEEACEHAAENGYLMRFSTNNGTSYHQVPYFQGTIEYHLKQVVADPLNYNPGVQGADMLPGDMSTTGTPTFYAMPCDKSVVADEEVLPFDDVEKIIMGRPGTKFAIAPCYCRYTALIKTLEAEGNHDYPSFEDFASGEFEDYMSPVCGHRVETCLMMGDEAEYWIWSGVAREITAEDALGYMKRSAEDGFILESCFSKDTGTICSCHGDCCGIIAEWRSLGDAAAIGGSKPFEQISHYLLDVDFDKCIKCGTCAERCPLSAITMDGPDGTPQVNEMCFRCGQCAYVCPAEARRLVARDPELNLELPRDFLDDDNMKAAYRFEHGLIK